MSFKNFGLIIFILVAPLISSAAFDLSAHRGNRAEFRENTLSALLSALKTGASSIEFDVHLTADEVPVIYHDYTLNPNDFITAPPGNGLIKNLTLDQIKSLRFKQDKPLQNGDEQIPTLKEFLRALKLSEHQRSPTVLHLEIKSELGLLDLSAPPEILVEKILSDLKSWSGQDQIILRSFYWKILEIAKEKAPQFPRILLVDKNELAQIDITTIVSHYRPLEVAPHYSDITPDLVHAWKKLGVGMNPWTVNDPETALKLIRWGITGLATDTPRTMTSFLRGHGIKIGATTHLCAQSFRESQ